MIHIQHIYTCDLSECRQSLIDRFAYPQVFRYGQPTGEVDPAKPSIPTGWVWTPKGMLCDRHTVKILLYVDEEISTISSVEIFK